ncbi:hypothetical protein C8F01DRAFT_1367461 [Mycena amicta]|nr:hypothetical protein C8F01DRAFT_1367461 [Mycena amicta]
MPAQRKQTEDDIPAHFLNNFKVTLARDEQPMSSPAFAKLSYRHDDESTRLISPASRMRQIPTTDSSEFNTRWTERMSLVDDEEEDQVRELAKTVVALHGDQVDPMLRTYLVSSQMTDYFYLVDLANCKCACVDWPKVYPKPCKHIRAVNEFLASSPFQPVPLHPTAQVSTSRSAHTLPPPLTVVNRALLDRLIAATPTPHIAPPASKHPHRSASLPLSQPTRIIATAFEPVRIEHTKILPSDAITHFDNNKADSVEDFMQDAAAAATSGFKNKDKALSASASASVSTAALLACESAYITIGVGIPCWVRAYCPWKQV